MYGSPPIPPRALNEHQRALWDFWTLQVREWWQRDRLGKEVAILALWIGFRSLRSVTLEVETARIRSHFGHCHQRNDLASSAVLSCNFVLSSALISPCWTVDFIFP